MFERFKVLPQLWRTGRLALRLLRDSRVPLGAKIIFGATVLYLLSPLDVVPDWIPVLGQADDLVVLMAGLNLFLKACPRWLVEEHESAIGRVGDRDDDPMAASGARGGGRSDTIDGQYRRMS
jgi:uncharacterized membrane protein YkvA (DUF1232 family)